MNGTSQAGGVAQPHPGSEVLDLPTVAMRLGLDPDAVERWLCRMGLIRRIAGEPRVIWADVLVATTPLLTPAEAARRLGVDRATLDAMIDRSPRDLPGAPVNVATGKARNHWRFNPAELDLWLASYRSWEAGRKRARVLGKVRT